MNKKFHLLLFVFYYLLLFVCYKGPFYNYYNSSSQATTKNHKINFLWKYQTANRKKKYFKKTSNDKRKKKSMASLFTPEVLSKVKDLRMLHSQQFRFKIVTLSLIDSIKLKTVKKSNKKILISQT